MPEQDIAGRLRQLGFGGASINEAIAEIERLRSRVDELSHQLCQLQWEGEKEVDAELIQDAKDEEIERLRSRVAGLEARLEVDHVWVADPDNADGWIRKEVPQEERAGFPYDGIACRDETIRLQDALIKKQRAMIVELEANERPKTP
jgi:hypothetical protein